MANPNPKTDQLAKGRGKRKKVERNVVSMRLDPEVRMALEAEAIRYDCFYGGEPWIAGLLSKIGKQELLIVPTPPNMQEGESFQSSRQRLRDRATSRYKNSEKSHK